MVFAMIIVTVLLFGAYQATSELFQFEIDENIRKKLYLISIGLLTFTIVQLVLGTQVREAIDSVKLTTDTVRSGWLEQTGMIFLIHRSFSWLVLIAGIWLMSILWKNQVKGVIYKLGILNFGFIALQLLLG